jgi:hypothetical protein
VQGFDAEMPEVENGCEDDGSDQEQIEIHDASRNGSMAAFVKP